MAHRSHQRSPHETRLRSLGLCVYARARPFDLVAARRAYDIAAMRKAIKAPVGLQALKYIEMHAPEWLPTVTRRRGKKSERLFWQSGGGYDRNITDAATLLSMIKYLHLNPVRRRLASRPEGWLWSSARWYEGKRDKASIAVDAIPSYWLSGA